MPFINEEELNGPVANGQPTMTNKEWMDEQKRKINEAAETDNTRALQLCEEALSRSHSWTDVRREKIGLWELKRIILTELGRDDEAAGALNMSVQLMSRR